MSRVKVDDVPWKVEVDDVRREIDWRARITSEESHFLIYAVHTCRCAESVWEAEITPKGTLLPKRSSVTCAWQHAPPFCMDIVSLWLNM